MRRFSMSSTNSPVSPYVREPAPTSETIHRMMDEVDDHYIKHTRVAPPVRGDATKLSRCQMVRDRYERAAAVLVQASDGKKKVNPKPSTAPRRASIASSTHTERPRPATTKFQNRLYAFYNRQVFSIGQDVDAGFDALPRHRAPEEQAVQENEAHDDDDDDDDDLESSPEDGFDESYLDANPTSDDLYDQCFEADWTASQVEKVVKDGVECRRVYALLKPHARILVHLFRAYATGGIVPTVRLDPIRLAAKAKLLEDLSVVVADASRHGVSTLSHLSRLIPTDVDDQPIPRHGLIPFLVTVAQVYLKRDELVVMLKRVAREGLDISSAVYHLLHDNVVPYASIQDGNHFRRLFFNHHDVQHQLFKFMSALTRLFQEHATPSVGDPMIASAINAGAATRPPSAFTGPRFMKITAFLTLLIKLGQIEGKFDEAKASHVFVSCLPIWPDELATVAQELTFSGFQEAFVKVVYFKCEKQLCLGEEDVCPASANSERCHCDPEIANDPDKYDVTVLVDALESLLNKCGAPAARRNRRQSIKHDSFTKPFHLDTRCDDRQECWCHN
ncbi:Aste57867_9429 [Aphanomyces stellatus]|uniref:Aste57867_9429 protein n=1 Tax=Aphanomyces stellatus TaxID=120398 RepID=A0A485KMV1_9STRA|nr:hypothetical protein As57867_009393 [Aphanomyces stellatus]VFT86309.1 Aste57867_9429 [Aphanomyces stellatus]